MASLAQVTKETRLILKIGSSVAILVFIIFLIFKGGSFIRDTFFPAPPAPPEEKFGALPVMSFPQDAATQAVPEFRVNTISGNLPTFSTTIKVYELKQIESSITALQSARNRAAVLGYTQNQQIITPTIYKWSEASSNN